MKKHIERDFMYEPELTGSIRKKLVAEPMLLLSLFGPEYFKKEEADHKDED